ncbi:hypothetical protein [Pedobacter sp. Leaf194]|uniref:hypothetical protein n=1 Tax=Pedobacter sp. Leaf194 TaxID=1736297 RepID=UPI00070284C5|nr:hypothetical protein [Pedobacter sp. Leaf194]KQS35667.1 hypothetical protein ASG14_09325 [Pedobacter sp. Leaf194]
MKLNEPVLKILRKKYEPEARTELKFARYDLAVKADSEGNAILLFMGVKDENGKIRGKRYARRLVVDKDGHVLKDHWEHKGKATP